MKNLSICLFVLGFSVMGCDSKPAAKPVTPPPAAGAASHSGPAATMTETPVDKKEGDSPAAETKEGEAPAADKKEDDAPAADKKEGDASAADKKE
jgi:hypothetical protein